MKKLALFTSFTLALVACSDSSSSTSADESSSSSSEVVSSSSVEESKDSLQEGGETAWDCSVTGGTVKVVSPAAGDTYYAGDSLVVVYGSDIEVSGGFRILYKRDELFPGWDLTSSSVGPLEPDGISCYSDTVWLDPDIVVPSEEAVIRVAPYNTGANAKAANSEQFTILAKEEKEE